MTIVEVLESTAIEGRVQVSKACKVAVERQMHEDAIPAEFVMFEMRKAPQLMTSKGDAHEYDEVGGPTYIVRSYSQIRGKINV